MAISSTQLTDQRNQMIKKIGVIYWKKLITAGIPQPEARKIAVAIAKYDLAQRRPNPPQKNLICHYCALICRANLWRGDLLMDRITEASQPRPKVA